MTAPPTIAVGGAFAVHPSVTPGALHGGRFTISRPTWRTWLIPASAGKYCGSDTSQHPAQRNTRGSSQHSPGVLRFGHLTESGPARNAGLIPAWRRDTADRTPAPATAA